LKTYMLHREQFLGVSILAGPMRYKHFVSRVADWETIWGLRNESGWVAAGDDAGNSCFPVWPHPDYAQACVTGAWVGNLPSPIDVHDFVENWLPEMAADSVFIAIFPTPEMRGVPIAALELQRDLQGALSQYE
jgi:hypothetical protein